jgi:hypothetical protein
MLSYMRRNTSGKVLNLLLNTGNEEIARQAKEWAESKGFTVTGLPFTTGDAPKWGGR